MYSVGQKVKIVPLVDSNGRADPQIQRYVNSIGTVVKSYCVTRDEMPDLSKMFIYPDVYCCDVRLDESGTILPGIPEAALEPYLPGG
ncbi:MAG: hypothetical protein A2144_01855 [Chloroflexi bacterium RBG_16_50_9]|nr:MAG: hypothetical protein A2144_01855 [Chloroflexi bacterium RBG_16_50_9]